MSDWRATVRMHLFAEPMFCDNDWIERSLDVLRELVEWRSQKLIVEFDIVEDWKQRVYKASTGNDYEWIEGAGTYA